MKRVCLINMPFVSTNRPAIGVSLLKSALEIESIPCDIHYLNFRLAKIIGYDLYERICSTTSDTWLGEYVFAVGLFGQQIASPEAYSADVLAPTLRGTANDSASSAQRLEELSSWVRMLSGHADHFLDECMTLIPWDQYEIVGFTSTFHQTVGSLALAARAKREYPYIKIVFGGANCEAEMGVAIHRQFPFIDYLCSGEADISFPALVSQILRKQEVGDISGVVRRVGKDSVVPTEVGAPVTDMDALPIPNYDDYVEQRSRVLGFRDPPQILFETARGCWWGQKHHCTFCGLNGETMGFRVKSARRAVDEIVSLARRYGTPKLAAVDNIISMNYFRTVLPDLAARNLDLDIFYETKSNLKRSQVKLLREAGVLSIQPGIESLSTDVLRIMKKGVTSLQNIQLLRWCAEFMIEVRWNILAGFPEERPEQYSHQAEIVPLLVHLPPPLDCGLLRLDRFSPLFVLPGEYGLTGVRPRAAYGYVFPAKGKDLYDMAYFFDFDYASERDPNSYTLELQGRIKEWFACYSQASLTSLVFDGHRWIWDTRPCSIKREHRLSGAHRLVYEYCDEARSRNALEAWAASANCFGGNMRLDEVLADLAAAKLMLYEDDHWLNLGVDGDYQIGVLASHIRSGTRLPLRSSEPIRRLYDMSPEIVQALVAERMRNPHQPPLKEPEQVLNVLR